MMLSTNSSVYKMLKKNHCDRKIYSLPRPFLSAATPHKQINFSSETYDASKFITSGLSISKIIFVGDVTVGKTSLVNRFCHRIFETNYKATIGVDFEVERFEILDISFNLQIWDTAGQERFKCIAQSYYRGANAIVLVFSLCDSLSLKHVQNWLREALKVNNDNPLVFLVGTKRDKIASTSYMTIEAEAVNIALELNAEYWSVSSKTGDCVDHFFNRMAALTFDSIMKRDFTEKPTLLAIGNINDLGYPHKNLKRTKFCNDKCKY